SSAAVGMLGAVIYVLGAAVLESIGYKMLSSGATPMLYRVEVATEEFFEMLGASLILYAVLSMSLRVPNSRTRNSAESRYRNVGWNEESPAFRPGIFRRFLTQFRYSYSHLTNFQTLHPERRQAHRYPSYSQPVAGLFESHSQTTRLCRSTRPAV